MSSLQKMQPDYEFDQNPYESFMRRHLQHYGYYTGQNQGFRNSFKPYNEWEKTHGYEVSNSSSESYSDMDEEDDEDFANKEKIQEDLQRSTQVVFNYEAGKMVAKLREPRNLYALNTEIGPQQAARWPDFLQVLDERVHHISYKPPLPEPFYRPNGNERMPMVRGKENGGRVVYNYELHIPRLMRYRVGGTREGCEQSSVMLTSPDDTTLLFESRFESGNMSRAVQVSEFEYELTLHYDLFTNKHTQWFYFRVRNTRASATYRFTIINFMKPDSLYNSGMKPVMYSQKDADKRRVGWIRAGQNIKYYRNNRMYSSRQGDKPYYSLTWTVQFPYDNDSVYIAHCYPYTYCDLQDYLMDLSNDPVKSRICKQRVLCRTQAGNLVYVLTITSSSQNPQDVKYKKAVVLTSRVHPGESNSSWMMKGFLDYLTSNAPDAKLLRDTFIFKIVPMLNPDGVIVGNYRCSLTGRDLNRNYKSALKTSFPSVWYTRNMIKRLVEEREVLVYCDLHGHSRKQNVFIYGCDNHDNPNKRLKERIFPSMMAKNAADKFKYEGCKFKVQKSKESTGRVVMWRMGIMNSYTMEATFCGSSLGKMKGYHFSAADFESLGYHFCDTLLDYCDPDPIKLEERMKRDIITKLEKQGLEASEVDLNEAYTSGMESSDGGSDSSVSDGLPVNIQFPPQSTKKKKKLRSRKERDQQRQKENGKKTSEDSQTDKKVLSKPEPKGVSSTKRDDRPRSGIPVYAQERCETRAAKKNDYLEALTNAYLKNGIYFGPEAVTPTIHYTEKTTTAPSLPFTFQGLCPHHEQAFATQYISQQVKTVHNNAFPSAYANYLRQYHSQHALSDLCNHHRDQVMSRILTISEDSSLEDFIRAQISHQANVPPLDRRPSLKSLQDIAGRKKKSEHPPSEELVTSLRSRSPLREHPKPFDEHPDVLNDIKGNANHKSNRNQVLSATLVNCTNPSRESSAEATKHSSPQVGAHHKLSDFESNMNSPKTGNDLAVKTQVLRSNLNNSSKDILRQKSVGDFSQTGYGEMRPPRNVAPLRKHASFHSEKMHGFSSPLSLHRDEQTLQEIRQTLVSSAVKPTLAPTTTNNYISHLIHQTDKDIQELTEEINEQVEGIKIVKDYYIKGNANTKKKDTARTSSTEKEQRSGDAATAASKETVKPTIVQVGSKSSANKSLPQSSDSGRTKSKHSSHRKHKKSSSKKRSTKPDEKQPDVGLNVALWSGVEPVTSRELGRDGFPQEPRTDSRRIAPIDLQRNHYHTLNNPRLTQSLTPLALSESKEAVCESRAALNDFTSMHNDSELGDVSPPHTIPIKAESDLNLLRSRHQRNGSANSLTSPENFSDIRQIPASEPASRMKMYKGKREMHDISPTKISLMISRDHYGFDPANARKTFLPITKTAKSYHLQKK